MLVNPTEFATFTEYWGPVAEITDTLPEPNIGETRTTTIYGFETFHHPVQRIGQILHDNGAAYGYVITGSALIHDASGRDGITLHQGEYFAIPTPAHFTLARNTRIVAVHTHNHHPLRAFGGPIEPTGRLRYIDGCTDTLLLAPPRLGDPCLNLLHFPPGINQTAHTHPTVRCGAVANGHGTCRNNNTELPLTPGNIWIIPPNTLHSFHTEQTTQPLQVIAYHPDTDHGPTDETHPMLNRTLINGQKADNTQPQHAPRLAP